LITLNESIGITSGFIRRQKMNNHKHHTHHIEEFKKNLKKYLTRIKQPIAEKSEYYH